jgi:hypothetical protein
MIMSVFLGDWIRWQHWAQLLTSLEILDRQIAIVGPSPLTSVSGVGSNLIVTVSVILTSCLLQTRQRDVRSEAAERSCLEV